MGLWNRLFGKWRLKRELSALDSALWDPDPAARWEALSSLQKRVEKIKHKGATDSTLIPSLLLALRADDSQVRAMAAGGLAATADQSTVDPLLHALRDPDSGVRTSAAHSLEYIGNPRAIDSLVPLLNDPIDDVRFRAGCALTRLGWRPATVQENVLHASATHSYSAQPAPWLVGAGPAAVAPLLELLTHPVTNVRSMALRALAGIDDPRVVAGLRTAAVDRALRTSAIEYLGSRGGAGELELLEDALGDGEEAVRVAAIKALTKLRESAADLSIRDSASAALRNHHAAELPELVCCLDSSDPDVRKLAANALRLMGSLATPAVPSLLRAVGGFRPGGPSMLVREWEAAEAAARALIAIGETTSVLTSLLTWACTPFEKCALGSLDMMADIGAPAVPALISCLRFVSEAAQLIGANRTPSLPGMVYPADPIRVMHTLRRLGPRAAAAAPVLRELAECSKKQTREEAQVALKEILPAPDSGSQPPGSAGIPATTCDVCNSSAGARSTTCTPGQFVAAVMKGFRPSAEALAQLGAMQGMSASDVEVLWFANAIKSQTDWLLCATCAGRMG